MNISQLEYIVALNRYRHFQKAATSCHVTQPTLSMQVSRLEDELDIIIFDRSKAPLMPTQVGLQVIEQAKKAIFEYKQVYEVARERKGKVEGNFRLAIIPTVSPYLIPLFIEGFSKKYPTVDLTILERTTCEIISMLKNDEVDAAIMATPLSNNALIERVLYYEPFRVFTSTGHPLANRKRVTEKDLSHDDIWILSEGHCFRSQALKICSSSIASPDSKIHFESGNMETLKNLVKRGQGYTLLPYLATLDLTENVIKFSNPEPTREISLVHGRSFLKEEMVVALQDFIVSVIPKELKSLKSDNLQIMEIQ